VTSTSLNALRDREVTGATSEKARLDSRWADLERLRSSHPMMDAVIEEQRGRRIRVGDQWLSDFASCNYLGFDLHPEIIAASEQAVRQWGTPELVPLAREPSSLLGNRRAAHRASRRT
jgi:7-keto-8-aminopelargonate synthetase-like enzyme